MKTVVLNVNGMSCSHCERAINVAVSEIKGIEKVNASVDTKTVTVTFDEDMIELQKIKEVIEEEGYDVVS